MRLGINIDHVATLRQVRGTTYPDILAAADEAIAGGADQITIHLREDRRHIGEDDLARLRKALSVPLNLEMAATEEMCAIALKYQPDTATLVPEKRRELTTEGGLDAHRHQRHLQKVVAALQEAEIRVSLFIDPQEKQIAAAAALKAHAVELHTGTYANAPSSALRLQHQEELLIAARYAKSQNLVVAAGHGLNLDNVTDIVHINEIQELNIGHSVVARAVFVGLKDAVQEMKIIISEARSMKHEA